ncbi:MAG: FadR family transcriptional regulator [Planctomycetaceae bacterium]|nr:MAG: FadR family transcriptional regulator [Planctomycetaceae bacterium]
MQTITRPKMRDQVSEQIKQYIIDGKLMPGDRLPTEHQLAETFGISRLSVREATKTLEFLGIVESKTGVGLTVGRINMERMTKHLGFHSGLLDADPQQLIDSRVIVETGVLPHVVRRMLDDPSIEAGLREIVDQFQTAKDLKSMIEIDIRFHHSLIDASGLQPLVAFNDLLAIFFQRFREAIGKVEYRKVGYENHWRLVDLLAAGKVKAASTELKRQIEDNKKRL